MATRAEKGNDSSRVDADCCSCPSPRRTADGSLIADMALLKRTIWTRSARCCGWAIAGSWHEDDDGSIQSESSTYFKRRRCLRPSGTRNRCSVIPDKLRSEQFSGFGNTMASRYASSVLSSRNLSSSSDCITESIASRLSALYGSYQTQSFPICAIHPGACDLATVYDLDGRAFSVKATYINLKRPFDVIDVVHPRFALMDNESKDKHKSKISERKKVKGEEKTKLHCQRCRLRRFLQFTHRHVIQMVSEVLSLARKLPGNGLHPSPSALLPDF